MDKPRPSLSPSSFGVGNTLKSKRMRPRKNTRHRAPPAKQLFGVLFNKGREFPLAVACRNVDFVACFQVLCCG